MVEYLFQYSFLFLVGRNILKLGRNGTLLVGLALAIPTKAITTCKPEKIRAEKITPIVAHLEQSLLSLTFEPSTSPSSHPRHHHQRSSSSSSSSSPLSLAVQPACGLGSTKRELLWTEVTSALTISLPRLLENVVHLNGHSQCDMFDCASSNSLSRDTNVDTLVTQFPFFRPMELHVALQKDSPVIRKVGSLGDYMMRCTPLNYVLSFV